MSSIRGTRPLALLLALLAMGVGSACATTLKAQGGDQEAAWVEWLPVASATGYRVTVQGGASSSSQILDDHLVRDYGAYWRADAPGLEPGTYTLKVVPLKAGAELAAQAVSTPPLAVEAHFREGFGFSGGVVPGAYSATGAPATGAKILHVTAKSANTVELSVVTDAKGGTTTARGVAEILAARGKGWDRTPLILRVVGTLRAAEVAGLKDGNFLAFQGFNSTDRKISRITLEGVGTDATLHGFGVSLKRTAAIEIRNLGIMLFGDDAVSMDTDNANVWIHDNDFFYGAPGADADQVKGDGTIDMKYNSSEVTISSNHFHDNGKTLGCGGGTETVPTFRVSFHRNWFDHVDSRNPRLHYATAHVYNNLFDGVSKYAVGNTTETSVFVEANHFRGCSRPMMISGQGTDAFDAAKGTYTLEGTFSGQDGGMTKAWGNAFEASDKVVSQLDHPTQFDAWVVANRTDRVPSTARSLRGNWAYSNFDTQDTMYRYAPDPVADVPAKVRRWAGRIGGGDLRWEFVDATDDESSEIHPALKSALVGYTSSLVRIQAEAGATTRADRIRSGGGIAIAGGWIQAEGDAPSSGMVLRSLTGSVLRRSSGGVSAIRVADLPAGLYLLEVGEGGSARRLPVLLP